MNIAPRVIATMRTVVRMEAMIIFMGVGRGRFSAARSKDSAISGKSERGRLAMPATTSAIVRSIAQAPRNSAQAGPVISDDDGIAGIGGVVLHAGGLPGNEPLKSNLPFEAGDVLRSVIGNAGNRI